jgi:uncharacterized protein (DUF885 family)
MRTGAFGRVLLTIIASGLLLAFAECTTAAAAAASSAPSFAALVDDYLDRFGHFHPSISAGNGIHGHDAELEDFSAASIAAEIKWLRSVRHEFDTLDASKLTLDEQREAVRGTYDPTYGGYFLGKLAAFKLRRDYQAVRGDAFNLREFNERVMTNGIAPWWAHRQLLMPGDRGAVVE